MLTSVPTQPHPSVRVYAKAVASASALMLVVGACSADDVALEADTPVAETAVNDALAEAESTEPEGRGTDDADTEAPDPNADTATGSADNRAEYCPHAKAGYTALGDLLDATQRKSTETGKPDDSGSVAIMNESGAQMLVHIDEVVAHWSQARAALDVTDYEATSRSVSGAAASQAYDEYLDHLEVFSKIDAQIATESATIMEYDLASASLVADGGMASLLTGTQALNTLLEFNFEHCDLDMPPGM